MALRAHKSKENLRDLKGEHTHTLTVIAVQQEVHRHRRGVMQHGEEAREFVHVAVRRDMEAFR